jgi:hypothetical protein
MDLIQEKRMRLELVMILVENRCAAIIKLTLLPDFDTFLCCPWRFRL